MSMVDDMMLDRDERSKRRSLAVIGIVIGLVFFALGAVMDSLVALVGLGVAAAVAVNFTWKTLGPRAVVVGAASAVVGSMVAWVMMRSMMRWVALSSDISPGFTVGGTAAILGSALLMGIIPGMGYVHYRRRFGASLFKAGVFGGVLSLVGSLPLVALLLGEISSTARQPAIPIAFLLAVPVVFALASEVSYRALDARVPAAKSLN